jgi:hypothetical protein
VCVIVNLKIKKTGVRMAVVSCGIEENLETFSLIWLDASVNDSGENIDAQQQLRTSINFLKTFEDSDRCEEYIRSKAKDDRIVLITSGRLGQIIVPRIHSLRQITSIYVYCKDKKINEAWANQFKKVNKYEKKISLLFSFHFRSKVSLFY